MLDRLKTKVYSDTMARKRKTKGFNPCYICTHPYRHQFEHAWLAGVPRQQIWEKYRHNVRQKKDKSFFKAMELHMRKEHFKEAKKYLSLDAPPDSPHRMTTTNLNDLSQGLMDIGGDMVKYWKDNPLVARKELKIGEIMKAQDSVTNRMKVQVTQDALKLQMAKMFGGFISETIEGEVDDSPTALLE